MTLNNFRVSIILRAFLLVSSLFSLILSACAPALMPTMTPPGDPVTPTELPITPNVEITEPPLVPPPTPEAEVIFPYYLPLTTKPDVAPQTINGVTTTIDWAYVDESRVSLHYTISGLDWPADAAWDAMSVRVTSSAIPMTAFSGAGGWNASPIQGGVLTGSLDELFWDGEVDATKLPSVDMNVTIPVEGPTSVGTFQFKFKIPVLKGIRLEALDQTVVANNVSMTLKRLTLNPSRVEALICFQMPSPVDWGLTASRVNINGKEFPFSGGGVAHGADGKNFSLSDAERCNDVGFDIISDESATSLTLTVPKLLGSVPEVVDQERVAIANQRLAAKGIQFEYVTVDHGANFEILKRPEGASDPEIYPLIWEALSEQYDGPWVFTVPIQR